MSDTTKILLAAVCSGIVAGIVGLVGWMFITSGLLAGFDERIIALKETTQELRRVPESVVRNEARTAANKDTLTRHEHWLETFKLFTANHVQDSRIHSMRNIE